MKIKEILKEYVYITTLPVDIVMEDIMNGISPEKAVKFKIKKKIGKYTKDSIIDIENLINEYHTQVELLDLKDSILKTSNLLNDELDDFIRSYKVEDKLKIIDKSCSCTQAQFDKYFPFIKIFLDSRTNSLNIVYNNEVKKKTKLIDNRAGSLNQSIGWSQQLITLLNTDGLLENFHTLWREDTKNELTPNYEKFKEDFYQENGSVSSVFKWNGPTDFLNKQLEGLEEYSLRRINRPVLFSNNKNELAMHYIDLSLINIDKIESDFETINDWMNAWIPNDMHKYFKLIIGKILVSKNPDRKGLYIQDEFGQIGKSVFLNALIKTLNTFSDDCAGAWNSSLKSEFKYEGVWDKIMIADSDCKNPEIVSTEFYHSYCSKSDSIVLSRKNKADTTVNIGGTPILVGNIDIKFSDVHHMRDRIIYIVTNSKPEDWYYEKYGKKDATGEFIKTNGRVVFKEQNTFKSKIEAEMFNFICHCYKEWERQGLNIEEDSIPTEDFIYDNVKDRYSRIKESLDEYSITNTFEITNDSNDYIPVNEVNIKCYELARYNQYEAEKLIKILNSSITLPNKKITKRVDHKVIKVYCGVKFNNPVNDHIDAMRNNHNTKTFNVD